MSIIRREKKDNFVIIEKTPLNDEKLSWQAKGLLAYLLGRPDNWRVYVSQLSKASKNGRDATRKTMQELVDSGYIYKERVRGDKGQLDGWEYVVTEWAEDIKVRLEQTEPCTENPTLEKPTLDYPTSENPTLLSNEELSNEVTKERKEESVSAQPQPTQSLFSDGCPKPEVAKKQDHDELTLQAAEWIKRLSEEMEQNLYPIDRITGKPTKYLSAVKARIKEHGYWAMLDMLAYKISKWKGTMYEENLTYKTLCREDNCRNYVWQAQNEKKKIEQEQERRKPADGEQPMSRAEQMRRMRNGEIL
jgi:hypothetical protein